MLTVKFMNYRNDNVNIFEADQVMVEESPYQYSKDIIAVDVHLMVKGDSLATMVLDDTEYHWDVAYVENAMGKTIQIIKPLVKPKAV